MKFELYKVLNGVFEGQWRWRLVYSNGKTIASGESYINRSDAMKAINLVMDTNRHTLLIVVPS